MAFIRYKQRGNKCYAYEIIAYWDKGSKKPKQKSKYLGIAKKIGGEILKPNKKVAEKSIVDFGDSYFIKQMIENNKFIFLLKKNFKDFDTILALIFYQIMQGEAMHNCQDWFEGNISKILFPGAKLKSQSISRVINYLGRDDIQSQFFRDYISMFFKGTHNILIDSTALPSSINDSLNNWGHVTNGIDQKVGCLMLVDKISKLPIFFRAIPGEIADVSTLKITIDQIYRLGLNLESAIFDAGYFSQDNIDFLCREKINFVTRMPRGRKKFTQLIDEIGNIESKANAVQYGKRGLFIKTKEITLYNHKMFAHVIFDPFKKAKDINKILNESFENEEESKNTDIKMKYGGYLILISRDQMANEEVLPTYYTRQSIEQVFDFAKSNNNILPLRVHSNESIRGYLFLVFLSLVIFVMMRQKLQSKYIMNKALLILRNLKAKIYENEIIIQEPTKKVKDIAKLLNVIVPTKVGI